MRIFADARDWGQFHTPKNLVRALAGEVGELAAEVQWLSDVGIQDLLGDAERRQSLDGELADVLIYLVRLADVCGVDLVAAAHAKVDLNERRYPTDLAKGTHEKYTSLGRGAAAAKGVG